MNPKLTPSQIVILRAAAQPEGRATIPTYKPTLKLLELGLITRKLPFQRWGNPTFIATEAGRVWLAENPS